MSYSLDAIYLEPGNLVLVTRCRDNPKLIGETVEVLEVLADRAYVQIGDLNGTVYARDFIVLKK